MQYPVTGCGRHTAATVCLDSQADKFSDVATGGSTGVEGGLMQVACQPGTKSRPVPISRKR
ncbi:MAG TPA: hypothetical protein VHU84_18905, partial [Lacipirellulaceae bacterium]|nr:hypothetical protein [Lacipirellulaceae bacterium]